MDEGTFAMPEIQPSIGKILPAMHASEQSSRRWIAVATDMRFHPLVGCGQTVKPADPSRGAWSRYEAWQDLICEASWKSRQVVNKGKTIMLERGELMAARSWLAQRWNWSEKQARSFIERLEAEFMIKAEDKCGKIGTNSKLVQQNGLPKVHAKAQQKGQQKQNLVKVISICNYDIYQTAKELSALISGQQKDLHHGQPDGQQKGQQRASKGPESYLEDTRVIQDPQKSACASARPQTIANPSSWSYNAQLDPEERKAQHDVGWAKDGSLVVMNGFEVDLTKKFPRVNQTAALNIVAGEIGPAKDRQTAKLVKAAIVRKFGYLEQEEAGKDRRYERSLAQRTSPPAGNEKPRTVVDESETKIKALALAIDGGDWKYARKFGWNSTKDAPPDILEAAKVQAEKNRKQAEQPGW